MRKTSQDGGDSTSITSGIENEIKKPSVSLSKIKKSSLKRKVQNFSNESDDGVVEPLLQTEKIELSSESAKYLLSKTKTDTANEMAEDKLLPEIKIEKSAIVGFSGMAENFVNGTKETCTSFVSKPATMHNHMNTNIFSGTDGAKTAPKGHVLVEIDGNKPGGYSSSPLIFTTAKIHTDGKIAPMEPVQMTPVPILSTAEGGTVKASFLSGNEKNMAGVFTLSKTNNIINNDNLNTKLVGNLTKESASKLMISSNEPVKGNYTESSFIEKKQIMPGKANTSSAVTSDITDNISKAVPVKSAVSNTIKSQTIPTDKHSYVNDFTPEADVNKNFESNGKPINSLFKDENAKIDDMNSVQQLQCQKNAGMISESNIQPKSPDVIVAFDSKICKNISTIIVPTTIIKPIESTFKPPATSSVAIISAGKPTLASIVTANANKSITTIAAKTVAATSLINKPHVTSASKTLAMTSTSIDPIISTATSSGKLSDKIPMLTSGIPKSEKAIKATTTIVSSGTVTAVSNTKAPNTISIKSIGISTCSAPTQGKCTIATTESQMKAVSKPTISLVSTDKSSVKLKSETTGNTKMKINVSKPITIPVASTSSKISNASKPVSAVINKTVTEKTSKSISAPSDNLNTVSSNFSNNISANKTAIAAAQTSATSLSKTVNSPSSSVLTTSKLITTGKALQSATQAMPAKYTATTTPNSSTIAKPNTSIPTSKVTQVSSLNKTINLDSSSKSLSNSKSSTSAVNQKSATVNNQNQLQSSDRKKDKLK